MNYDAEKANCFVVSRVLSVPYRDNGGLTKSSMVLSVGNVDLPAERCSYHRNPISVTICLDRGDPGWDDFRMVAKDTFSTGIGINRKI